MAAQIVFFEALNPNILLLLNFLKTPIFFKQILLILNIILNII
jgi:hypothetical protein